MYLTPRILPPPLPAGPLPLSPFPTDLELRDTGLPFPGSSPTLHTPVLSLQPRHPFAHCLAFPAFSQFITRPLLLPPKKPGPEEPPEPPRVRWVMQLGQKGGGAEPALVSGARPPARTKGDVNGV